jgi:hypothetical protein
MWRTAVLSCRRAAKPWKPRRPEQGKPAFVGHFLSSHLLFTMIEESPWLFSESTFPLSSAFVHHALLLDLAFKQFIQVPANDSFRVADLNEPVPVRHT